MQFTCKVIFDYLCFKAWNDRVKHYRIGSTDQVIQMANFIKVLLSNKQIITSEKSFSSSYNTLGNSYVYPLLLHIVTTKLNTFLSSDHPILEGNLEVIFFQFGQSGSHGIDQLTSVTLMLLCHGILQTCKRPKSNIAQSEELWRIFYCSGTQLFINLLGVLSPV